MFERAKENLNFTEDKLKKAKEEFAKGDMAETINICEFSLYAHFRPVHTWMHTDLGDIHHEIHNAIGCAKGVTA